MKSGKISVEIDGTKLTLTIPKKNNGNGKENGKNQKPKQTKNQKTETTQNQNN